MDLLQRVLFSFHCRQFVRIGAILLTGSLLTGCAAELKPADMDLAAHLIVTQSGGQVHPDWYTCGVFIQGRTCDWQNEKQAGKLLNTKLTRLETEKDTLTASEREELEKEIDDIHSFGSIKALSNHIITSFGAQHAEGGTDELLLFLNGGLNSSAASVERARKQHKWILDEGKGAYPVFLAWPTPPVDSYWDNVSRVRDSVRFNKIQGSWPLYVAGDVLETVASAPVAYSVSANRFRQTIWRDDRILKLTADAPLLALSEDGKPEDCEVTENERSLPVEYKITKNKNLIYDHRQVKLDGECVQVADIERDFGREDFGYFAWTPIRLLGIPLIDTLGRTAWEQMLRRTQTMIRRGVEFNPLLRVEYSGQDDFCIDPDTNDYYDNPEDVASFPRKDGDRITTCRIQKHKREFPAGSGAIARFFQILNDCRNLAEGEEQIGARRLECDIIEPDREDSPASIERKEGIRNALLQMRITLIGHSMGAIAGNEILKAVPDLPWENIVYMAAASSIKDTERAVSPILIDNDGQTKFYNLMLHPLNDAREISFLEEDKYGFFKGVVPAGSLLAWIDTYFEQPKTVQDRTMGRWDNLRATRDVFQGEARKWMVWRVFNLDPTPEVEDVDLRYSDRIVEGHCNDDPATFDASEPLRHPMKHGDFNCLDQRWWTKRFWTGETELNTVAVTFEGGQATAH